MKITRTQKDRAIRKTEIAIDKLIDIQSMGIKIQEIDRILSQLNELASNISRLD